MIYLGTGFCPAGWNTNNGEFTFNEKVMPDPKAMFDELHREHFKVVLHVAYPTGIREMKGTVRDACDSTPARGNAGELLLGHAPRGARHRRGRLVAR